MEEGVTTRDDDAGNTGRGRFCAVFFHFLLLLTLKIVSGMRSLRRMSSVRNRMCIRIS